MWTFSQGCLSNPGVHNSIIFAGHKKLFVFILKNNRWFCAIRNCWRISYQPIGIAKSLRIFQFRIVGGLQQKKVGNPCYWWSSLLPVPSFLSRLRRNSCRTSFRWCICSKVMKQNENCYCYRSFPFWWLKPHFSICLCF